MTRRDVAFLGAGALISTAAQLLTQLLLNRPLTYKETP